MSACLWMVAVQFLQRISVFSPTKAVEGVTISSETRLSQSPGWSEPVLMEKGLPSTPGLVCEVTTVWYLFVPCSGDPLVL